MATPFYKLGKNQFRTWLQNFSTVASAHAVQLSLDIAELAEISGANTNFGTALNSQETARAAALGATANCDDKFAAALATVSKFNAMFQADPTVPSELIADLGLLVHASGSSPVPVFTPADLGATGQSNGTNSLKWAKNGNASGTSYVVEAAYDNSDDWFIVDTVNRASFKHTGQTPGRMVSYRVYAKRGESVSDFSGVATVYGNSGGQQLAIAA